MSIVIVVPYCDDWPKHFLLLRNELLAVFASTQVAIEHIGSTAVPGLAAKPVMDILLGADSLVEIEAKIKPLSEFGYAYVSKYERELPMRRYFVKSSENTLRVHLHGVVQGSVLWQQHLLFRDLLRSDAGVRSEYQSLKLRLAKQFADNKPAYSAAKNPFIESVLAHAFNKTR